MMLQVPNVLSPERLRQFRGALQQAEWADGKITAGYQSGKAKHNQQLLEDHLVARQLGEIILDALSLNNLIMSATLPLKVFPPLFNCYQSGSNFGVHIYNAMVQLAGVYHNRLRGWSNP